MNRRSLCFILVVVFVVAFPLESWAPLVYRPGEGWVYESPGSEGKWTRTRAKDQLESLIGTIPRELMARVDRALAIALALPYPRSED